MEGQDPTPDREPQPFTMPLLATLYGSAVVIAVIFVLRTDIGRDIEDKLEAPARTMIAAPLVILALIVFTGGLVALLAPAYRRHTMRVVELAAWMIPAWAVLTGMVLGAISYALGHLD
jgi:hypothetical protein